MKELQLINTTEVAVVDYEDFERLSKISWRLNVDTVRRAGTVLGGVKSITLANTVMKDYSDFKYDHKDNNKLNNKKDNLRLCTHSENMCNRLKFKNCSSKYKGVSWNTKNNKWMAYVCKNSKQHYLGLFEIEIDAAKAYNTKALELHSEFALLNKDENGNPL